MAHQTTIPPPDSGGGSRQTQALGGPAQVTVTWVSSHELTPAAYMRRVEKADAMRLKIIEMLEAAPADHSE